MLYKLGVLGEYCGAEAAAQCRADGRAWKCCDAQMLGFTLISTVALLPSDALVAAYGEAVDRVGPRRVFLFSSLLAWFGFAAVGVNASLNIDALWFVAFFSLGAAGPGIFFSVLFLAEKYPPMQHLVVSLAAATFDGSAIIFFLFSARPPRPLRRAAALRPAGVRARPLSRRAAARAQTSSSSSFASRSERSAPAGSCSPCASATPRSLCCRRGSGCSTRGSSGRRTTP